MQTWKDVALMLRHDQGASETEIRLKSSHVSYIHPHLHYHTYKHCTQHHANTLYRPHKTNVGTGH